MKNIYQLFAFAMAFSSVAFPGPALLEASRPRAPRTVCQLEDCFFSGNDGSFRYLEASCQGGRVTVQFEGQALVLDAAPPGCPGLTPVLECHPVPEGAKDLYQCVKFRHGRFFRKHGEDAIQEYDPGTRRWSTLCRTKGRFSQFEILPGGDIVLLCAGIPDPAFPVRTGMDMTIQRYLQESFRFLDVRSRGADGKGVTIKPPADLEALCRQVEDVPVFDRIVPFDDKLLLIHSHLGLLYLFDPAASSLVRVDVPWPSLTPAFLDQVRNRQGLPTARLVVSQGLFPSEIQVYPRDAVSATVLVRMNNHLLLGPSKARDLEERRRGGGFVLPLREYSEADIRAGEDWSVFDLDLAGRTLRPSMIEKPLAVVLTRFADEFWMDPLGRMHDLKNRVSLGGAMAAPPRPGPSEPLRNP